jgi:hypothetical protein
MLKPLSSVLIGPVVGTEAAGLGLWQQERLIVVSVAVEDLYQFTAG